ncbi:hypothetical protein C7999DRAFT_18076 [Corynascus novoguineensis]|uniref:Uncharacterized protein n=1 Tax=Corynascus novoguineensis TaxID=1126955 RepID=A0AAN7CM62_9PEZI|nr:hypothetical protein C7999DRAFT_18076 [Corynascus novoguineensis]
MAAYLVDRIKGLSQSLARQQKVVDDQQETLHLLQEANGLVDVERLTSVTMEEEKQRWQTARAILDDLNAQLHEAINLWGQLDSVDQHRGEPPWLRLSKPPSPDQSIDQPEDFPGQCESQFISPANLGEPAVGVQRRYQMQWRDRTRASTIQDLFRLDLSRPSQWWMEERSHYALCWPSEQVQLETSAQAVRFNRCCALRHMLPSLNETAPMQSQSYSQEVREDQYYFQDHPSALALPPLYGAQASSSRKGRADPVGSWSEGDYDPDFWQNNLRAEDIWTSPHGQNLVQDEPVSPRTVTAGLSGVRRDRRKLLRSRRQQ